MTANPLPPKAAPVTPGEPETTTPQPPRERRQTGREMLINATSSADELRIAVVRRGLLEELYTERASSDLHIGNIYRGRVTNIEPSIQAAFIDFGISKNGFLHISDLHPQYFPVQMQPKAARRGRDGRPDNRSGGGRRGGNNRPPETPIAVAPSTVTSPEIANTPPVEPSPVNGGDVPPPIPQEIPAEAPPIISHLPATETDRPDAEGPIETTIRRDQPLGSSGEDDDTIDAVTPPVVADELVLANNDSEPVLAEASAPATEVAADAPSVANTDADDDEDEDEIEEWDVEEDGRVQAMEKVGRKIPRRSRPLMQQCLRRGQEVIVQVTKEGIGTKGPSLTTYLSIPGRYLVMMPGMQQLGVSRKVEDDQSRREAKRLLESLKPPENLGFIIRTAGAEQDRDDIRRDLDYLVKIWKSITQKLKTQPVPSELFEESDLVIRTIRDVFDPNEVDRIVVDNPEIAQRIRDFFAVVSPDCVSLVHDYTDDLPMFHRYNIEREIEKIHSRRVEMANGGSLVIDSAEALVAIDVNSGRYRGSQDAELMAYNMNREAVKEICRQLKLRDLGGVIVIDFIDMRDERHRNSIEQLLRQELSSERAKTKVLKMSQFCMIEMTRQRVRPSLKRSIFSDCPHCRGTGLIKTPESVTLDVMRRLTAGCTRADIQRMDVRVFPTVATHLLNVQRRSIIALEDRFSKQIHVHGDIKLAGDEVVIEPFDARGSMINIHV